ncbi:MAG: cytochrome b/b6 domain-containing protein [Slackia sp.]|nr:cytochrome b/b6 domain-containing protein [Slackia sp.]
MAHLAHYREAHPLPFRITHWVNLVAMAFLVVTGFYIHFPWVPSCMGIARGLHLFCGFVIMANVVARVILAFFVKSAPTGGTRETVTDYKTWLPQADNRHQGVEWIKYYLFLKKDHPLSAKLGVPQKISYLAVPVLIAFMFFTGLCLWSPTANLPFFESAIAFMGGAMSVRIVHYVMTFVFILFTMLHVYLANIEGLAPTKLMFFGIEHGGLVYDPDKHVIVGEDLLDR